MGSPKILLSAGSNAKGQLGIGSCEDAHTFTPCRFRHAKCESDSQSISADSSIWQLPDRTIRVAQIACGANHTVLSLEQDDGFMTLWGTGDGRRGQLGMGFEESDCGSEPRGGHWDRLVEAETETKGGTEPETGVGARPQAGTKPRDHATDPPLATPEEPEFIGSHVFRRLVLPELTIPLRSGDTRMTAIGVHAYSPRIVAAAWETTYVVLSRRSETSAGRSGNSTPGDSDLLLSMGSNDFGALGIGDAPDGVQKPEADKTGRRGGLTQSHGSSRATGMPQAVPLDHILSDISSERRIIRVRSLHAGPRHVVAELVVTCFDADGSSPLSRTVLVGWGAARHGQLGPDLGEARFIARPTLLPIDVHSDPMVSCAVGNQHTVVLHMSGRISALGSNKQRQIPSLTAPTQRICRLGCTWNSTYMQSDNILLSTGNNAQGQLGLGHTVNPVSADAVVDLPIDCVVSNFVCGSEHVLASVSNSPQEAVSVFGWGWNEHGNMGLGSLGNVSVPTKLWPREDITVYNKYPQKVICIWAGCATSWLLVE